MRCLQSSPVVWAAGLTWACVGMSVLAGQHRPAPPAPDGAEPFTPCSQSSAPAPSWAPQHLEDEVLGLNLALEAPTDNMGTMKSRDIKARDRSMMGAAAPPGSIARPEAWQEVLTGNPVQGLMLTRF